MLGSELPKNAVRREPRVPCRGESQGVGLYRLSLSETLRVKPLLQRPGLCLDRGPLFVGDLNQQFPLQDPLALRVIPQLLLSVDRLAAARASRFLVSIDLV